jgi:hypothetical protein
MVRKRIILALILAGIALRGGAGIRGPGKYNGIILFDRWGGCYLYSGIYLMYFSDASKGLLRRYSGQPLQLDAREVVQPHNPGDGIIRRFKVLGPAVETRDSLAMRMLSLRVRPDLEGNSVRFKLMLHNSGHTPLTLRSDTFGLTVLARRSGACNPEPSNGPSFALITRADLETGQDQHSGEVCSLRYSWHLEQPIPDTIALQTASTYEISLAFLLPRGEYELLVGYGGGVHQARPNISNAVSFDIGGAGVARVVAASPQ